MYKRTLRTSLEKTDLPREAIGPGSFFLLTTKYMYLILYFQDMKRLPENPEFTEMRHDQVFLHTG